MLTLTGRYVLAKETGHGPDRHLRREHHHILASLQQFPASDGRDDTRRGGGYEESRTLPRGDSEEPMISAVNGERGPLRPVVGERQDRVKDAGKWPAAVIPPLISHLEAVTAMSGFRRFHEVLAQHHTVVRYDRWGTGLSDRDRSDFTLGAEIQVILDLADHLKLRSFALMGPSHGGPVAVAVAHRAAGRVSHLIVYGTGARALIDAETWRPLRELILANCRLRLERSARSRRPPTQATPTPSQA
jgi:hypothetical protein